MDKRGQARNLRLPKMTKDNDAMSSLRWFLVALLGIGIAGTSTDLLLIGHIEDRSQLIPLVLLLLGFLTLIRFALAPSRISVQVFRYLMAIFVLSGIVGFYLHYSSNSEFEMEMYPSLEGFALAKESLTGALPVLAPMTMTNLGLLGLVTTYRHPKG